MTSRRTTSPRPLETPGPLGALTGLQKYFDKQWANWRSAMLEPPSTSPVATAATAILR